MAHSVTQISNTVSPEIAASPGMSDILATVDPEIEASQLDYTFETATIENEEVPLCMSQSPQAANKPDELVLGLLTEIPRWVRGSVINFAAIPVPPTQSMQLSSSTGQRYTGTLRESA
jgi:hypothetical protein